VEAELITAIDSNTLDQFFAVSEKEKVEIEEEHIIIEDATGLKEELGLSTLDHLTPSQRRRIALLKKQEERKQ